MILRQLFDRETFTFTYLLGDPASGQAVLIDPVLEQLERDETLIEQLGLKLGLILETHVHADHVTSARLLRERTGAQIGLAASARIDQVDLPLEHGQILNFGSQRIEVRRTPGHTDSCTTFVVREGARTMAFTGDTLFVRGCGRTDFQGGDAKQLHRSVRDQIFSLPLETVIFPGHDYKGHNSSTVAEEKLYNPRLAESISESEFCDIMDHINLAYPRQIDVALPANLVCGPVSGIPNPDPNSFAELAANKTPDLSSYRVIDVRTPNEYHGPTGHVDRAELVPIGTLEKAADAWDRTAPLVLVCQSGGRSTAACKTLKSMGFADVTNLVGGMNAWTATT